MTNKGKSKAYKEGEESFLKNEESDKNPYEKGCNERKEWYDGWYSKSIATRHRAIFEKFGIKWE